MVRDFDDKKQIKSRNHSVLMENREKVTITGVQDVDSFDESTVILATDTGFMTLRGIDLRISKLNLEDGQLIVEGEIIELQYSEHDGYRVKGAGLFGRLFR